MKRIGLTIFALVALWLYSTANDLSLADGARKATGTAWAGIVDRVAGELSDDPGSPLRDDGPSSARKAPEPPGVGETRRRLAGLDVSPAGPMSGYVREDFPHWAADGTEFGWREPDGSCDVRDDALVRDGRGVALDEDCAIYKGTWLDPYTGRRLDDPQDVDIDHVVPLANAYRSGASTWGASDREAYANDPAVLLSADDGTNQAKGDKGPEAWLPPNGSFHCEYARRWVWVKSEWALSVNPAEKAALREMLGACGRAGGLRRG